MNTNDNENVRKLAAIAVMVVLGGVLVAVVGEAAKYVIQPHDALYFLLVNKVYILAAAVFLLLLGLNRVNMGSTRNMVAVLVLTLVGLVILWQLDKIASGILWSGMYPTVYGRIPEKYLSLFLQSLDVIGLVVGAFGAFMLMLKILDFAKDQLAGPAKKAE